MRTLLLPVLILLSACGQRSNIDSETNGNRIAPCSYVDPNYCSVDGTKCIDSCGVKKYIVFCATDGHGRYQEFNSRQWLSGREACDVVMNFSYTEILDIVEPMPKDQCSVVNHKVTCKRL